MLSPERFIYAPVACLVLLTLCFPAFAQDKRERAALRMVDFLSVEMVLEQPAPGFNDTRFLVGLREKLQGVGLSPNPTTGRLLRLSILPKYDERLKVYLVSVTLELLKPDRTGNEVQYVSQWVRRDVLAAPTWAPMRESIDRLVDEFITGWRGARS